MKKIIFMITFIIIVFAFDINQTIACPEGEGWGEAQCTTQVQNTLGQWCTVIVTYCARLSTDQNGQQYLDVVWSKDDYLDPACGFYVHQDVTYWGRIYDAIWADLLGNMITAFPPCSSGTYTITKITINHCLKIVNDPVRKIMSLVQCNSNYLCEQTMKVCVLNFQTKEIQKILISSVSGQSDCPPWTWDGPSSGYSYQVPWESECMTPQACGN